VGHYSESNFGQVGFEPTTLNQRTRTTLGINYIQEQRDEDTKRDELVPKVEGQGKQTGRVSSQNTEVGTTRNVN